MCKDNENIEDASLGAAAGKLQEAAEMLRKAAGETSSVRDLGLTASGTGKHPHEPPVLIEDGSFIIECDQDIIADGPGGVYDPITGARRRKHKRRRPGDATVDPSIACVRVVGGELTPPTGVLKTDQISVLLTRLQLLPTSPVSSLLAKLGVGDFRFSYPMRGCKIKIYWDDHPCDPDV
jgi:hypothetical protein